MKHLYYCLAIFILSSCSQNKPTSENLASDYYNYGDSIESAGVRMIPIKTPVGEFNVWTKRFGNNSKIKKNRQLGRERIKLSLEVNIGRHPLM